MSIPGIVQTKFETSLIYEGWTGGGGGLGLKHTNMNNAKRHSSSFKMSDVFYCMQQIQTTIFKKKYTEFPRTNSIS